MSGTALAIAERIVRDTLETIALRHGAKADPVSQAVLRLAESLAEHLDAEVKQMRAEQ